MGATDAVMSTVAAKGVVPRISNAKFPRVSLMLLIDRGNDLGNSLLKYHFGTVQMGIFRYRKITKDGKNYYPNIRVAF